MPGGVAQGEIRRRPTGVGDGGGFCFSFLLFFILLMFYPQQGFFYNQRKKLGEKGRYTKQCARFYANNKMKPIQTYALEKMPVNDYHLSSTS